MLLLLLLHALSSVCFLSAPACVSAVGTEAVVGLAGGKVTLPCRTEAVKQRAAEVCWGRGKPSLFTCHNTVINSAADRIIYRKSDRYSVLSSSSSLVIFNLQPSDSGFYHCRVELPGLFNDQTFTVHLIIISSARSVASTETSELSDNKDTRNLNTPHSATSYITEEKGSGVAGDDTTEPVVAAVQSASQQQQIDALKMFVGNTVRSSFIIFIPSLLLITAYRVWKSKRQTDRRTNQSEEAQEEGSSV